MTSDDPRPERLTKLTKKQRAQERAERLAALKAEQARTEKRRRFLAVSGVVAAALVIIVGVIVVQQVTEEKVKAPETSEFGLVRGPDDAPHSLVVYEDFLCPVCAQFEAAAGDQLAELAADGDVRIEYRPFSLLRQFSWSHDALNAFFVVQDAAGDEVAREFHDVLYDEQPAEAGPYPSVDELVGLAVRAGAVEDDVRPGIESDAMADRVEAANAEAGDAGVDSTPIILLDGEDFREGSSWEEIASNLADEIRD